MTKADLVKVICENVGLALRTRRNHRAAIRDLERDPGKRRKGQNIWIGEFLKAPAKGLFLFWDLWYYKHGENFGKEAF
jgi:hypothetical protein